VKAADIEASSKKTTGIISGITTGIGNLFSDPRTKNDLAKAKDKDVEEFVNALQEATFSYKDGYGSDGEHLGITTDELEKSRFGKQMVEETANGMKRVKLEQGFGAMLATLANQQRRIKKLESKRGK
jgi:hypothetical protein